MLKNVFILIVAIAFSCSDKKETVDLIVHNALIYSVDSTFGTYEAMAIKSGKIIELNSSETILKKYSSKEISDAKGENHFTWIYRRALSFHGLCN